MRHRAARPGRPRCDPSRPPRGTRACRGRTQPPPRSGEATRPRGTHPPCGHRRMTVRRPVDGDRPAETPHRQRREKVAPPAPRTRPAGGYVELHCHSAYSFLDGASRPEELAAMAIELGYEALALTDHDGVSGSLDFAHAARLFGIRAITGAELTLDGGAHVTLLVETARGYANLCRLL